MKTSDCSSDAATRVALAWLAIYFMILAGGLAAEREVLLQLPDRLVQAIGAVGR